MVWRTLLIMFRMEMCRYKSESWSFRVFQYRYDFDYLSGTREVSVVEDKIVEIGYGTDCCGCKHFRCEVGNMTLFGFFLDSVFKCLDFIRYVFCGCRDLLSLESEERCCGWDFGIGLRIVRIKIQGETFFLYVVFNPGNFLRLSA